MKVTIIQGKPDRFSGRLIAIPVIEGGGLTGAGAALDKRLKAPVAEAIRRAKFEGKPSEAAIVHPTGKGMPAAVALFGVGGPPFSTKAARKFAASAVRQAGKEKITEVVLSLPEIGAGEDGAMAQAVTEGAILGGYRFDKYRRKAREQESGRADAAVMTIGRGVSLNEVRKGVKKGKIYSRAAIFARELVNEPASEMTPKRLVEAAKGIAAKNRTALSLKVMDRAALARLGAGGLLAVARGSDEAPYMIHLTYRPVGKPKARVALVGKGLTFDSGGLSLKPSEGMEDMKIDMSGAAAVLGAMSVMAEVAPAVEVHAVAGLCENMPSGRAIKPGDVVRTMSGQTVEILNTDAEGRVTLADTLHYGRQLRPDFMVDLATLTGACMVALGQEVAGLMSSDDGLAARLLEASEAEGEMLWRLPLPEEYDELIESPVADLKNISGTKYGGAITAGLFLKRFVGDAAWAHIDIAGPAWAEKDTVPHQPRGATGFGARTVLRFIESL